MDKEINKVWHNVRRKDRVMSEEKTKAVLKNAKYGFLATMPDFSIKENNRDYPYGFPISFVQYNNKIYFHCAHKGHKIDNINNNPNICFCVVGDTKPIYDKNFTTYFESVIIYGRAKKEEDPEIKTKILFLFAEKYLPQHMDKAPKDIERSLKRTAIYEIKIEHITGKEKKPLKNK